MQVWVTRVDSGRDCVSPHCRFARNTALAFNVITTAALGQ
jgi:hypothetical protein